MSLATLCQLLFLLLFCCLSGAQELLLNPGFENGVVNWKADGFTLRADYSTVHGGVASGFCTGRWVIDILG